MTREKLIKLLGLTNVPENQKTVQKNIRDKFINFWEKYKKNECVSGTTEFSTTENDSQS